MCVIAFDIYILNIHSFIQSPISSLVTLEGLPFGGGWEGVGVGYFCREKMRVMISPGAFKFLQPVSQQLSKLKPTI